MRMTEGGTPLTPRNRPVRMCIAHALVELLETKQIEEVTVTGLVRKANVSRMTFYKYYKSKHEVLSDYMYELINDYMIDVKNRTDIGTFCNLKYITHCFTFFKPYNTFFRVLLRSDMYSIIIDTLNGCMEEYLLPKVPLSSYELYYYTGALCNIFMKWMESGMKETPEEIAKIVYRHIPKQWENLC